MWASKPLCSLTSPPMAGGHDPLLIPPIWCVFDLSLRTCVQRKPPVAYARTQQNAKVLLYRGVLAKCQVDSLPKSEGQNDPLKNRTSCSSGRLARSKSAESAALCPSDMMLCVISYWVLSGAKRRQIQQLRCCVLPRQAVETEGCLSETDTTQRTSRSTRHL